LSLERNLYVTGSYKLSKLWRDWEGYSYVLMCL